ncbi:MAG TPA: hypothetical protein VNY27_01575 [Solirubrobacteraceae bacterium]|jgi:hypothetical protein|nr:hypothetical protein [Solirubrobacteraceae bacterium]
MSRLKLVLLSLLAAFAISAIASASASARCGGPNPTHWVFCNNEEPMKELGTPPEFALGLGGLQLLEGKVTGVAAKFHCLDVHILAWLLLLGNFHALLIYLHCIEIKPSGCKLSTAQEKEIKTKLLPGRTIPLGAPLGSPPQMEVKGAGATEEFVALEVEKNGTMECAIPTGNYSVTGNQVVELPEPESMKVNHELVATKANSHLSIGGTAGASYSGTALVHLGSLLAWGILPGT